MSTVTVEKTRTERLNLLKQFFLESLVEDPIDGTRFDCDILDAIEIMEKKYKNE